MKGRRSARRALMVAAAGAVLSVGGIANIAYATEPVLDLTIKDAVVGLGGSTELTWTSSGFSFCWASGGWSGAKLTNSGATVGPISKATTYTLTCTGRDGTATAMQGVSVYGLVWLTWLPPTTRTDGALMENPDGYWIYYGTSPRSYTTRVRIQNPDARARVLRLPSGTYYVAMTTLDLDGLESELSNEVIREVN